jgi:hypothetical protein
MHTHIHQQVHSAKIKLFFFNSQYQTKTFLTFFFYYYHGQRKILKPHTIYFCYCFFVAEREKKYNIYLGLGWLICLRKINKEHWNVSIGFSHQLRPHRKKRGIQNKQNKKKLPYKYAH